MVLLLFWTSALLGTWLLLRFIRGRRTDDHPLCRRCTFDLTGLPATSTRCPECGADLAVPRAIRTGHVVRSKLAGLAAIFFLLLAMPFFAAQVLDRTSTVELVRYKPAFWLAYDARSNYRRAAALNELLNRFQTGKLAAGGLSALVDHALAQQADHARTWDAAWGDFVERAERLGAVSATQWSRYIDQMIRIELDPPLLPPTGELTHDPSRVRRGSELARQLTQHVRGGTSGAFAPVSTSTLSIGNITLPARYGVSRMNFSVGRSTSWIVDIPADAVADLPDGPVTAIATFATDVTGRGVAPATAIRQSIPLAFNLAPHHDYAPDNPYRTAFETALSFSGIQRRGDDLFMTVSIRNAPVGLAHAVVLRSGKGDVLLENVVCAVGDSWTDRIYIDLRRADLPTARLWIMPNRAVADRTHDIPVIWSGSLDRALPVFPTPASRPAGP